MSTEIFCDGCKITARNKRILGQVPGEVRTYMSIDTVITADDATICPVNSLDLSGVFKIGVPVILMRLNCATTLGYAS